MITLGRYFRWFGRIRVRYRDTILLGRTVTRADFLGAFGTYSPAKKAISRHYFTVTPTSGLFFPHLQLSQVRTAARLGNTWPSHGLPRGPESCLMLKDSTPPPRHGTLSTLSPHKMADKKSFRMSQLRPYDNIAAGQ